MHCHTRDSGGVRAAQQWKSSGDSVWFSYVFHLLMVVAIFVDLLKYRCHFATNL